MILSCRGFVFMILSCRGFVFMVLSCRGFVCVLFFDAVDFVFIRVCLVDLDSCLWLVALNDLRFDAST